MPIYLGEIMQNLKGNITMGVVCRERPGPSTDLSAVAVLHEAAS